MQNTRKEGADLLNKNKNYAPQNPSVYLFNTALDCVYNVYSMQLCSKNVVNLSPMISTLGNSGPLFIHRIGSNWVVSEHDFYK